MEAIQSGYENLIDTADAQGSFKTLGAALKAADLVETLKGTGPFTVLAPTDEAFAKVPKATFDELLKPENKAELPREGCRRHAQVATSRRPRRASPTCRPREPRHGIARGAASARRGSRRATVRSGREGARRLAGFRLDGGARSVGTHACPALDPTCRGH